MIKLVLRLGAGEQRCSHLTDSATVVAVATLSGIAMEGRSCSLVDLRADHLEEPLKGS